MATIKTFRHISATVFLAVLCAAAGCNEVDVNTGDIPPVRSDIRKTELLQQLQRRFADPELHFELGKIYQTEGQWDKAVFEFRVAKGYNPVHWDAAAATVKTFYQAGKNDRAVIMSENYINEAGYSATSSLQLGKAFQNEMLEDEALTCYQQALRIAPDSAGLNKQVGYYYLAKNDLVRAEQYLRRSFEIEPSAEVSGALGRLGIAVELPRKNVIDAGKLDQMFEQEPVK